MFTSLLSAGPEGRVDTFCHDGKWSIVYSGVDGRWHSGREGVSSFFVSPIRVYLWV